MHGKICIRIKIGVHKQVFTIGSEKLYCVIGGRIFTHGVGGKFNLFREWLRVDCLEKRNGTRKNIYIFNTLVN